MKFLGVIVLTLLIFLATAGFAEEAVSNFKVDCSTVESSPGCQSFNEMVTKKDKDLMSYLAGPYDTYVCFRKDEDNFVVVSISRTYDVAYRKLPANPGVTEQDGHIFFQRYKDGLTDDFWVEDGKWRKASSLGEVFRTPKGVEPGAIADDTEITISRSFQNLKKTMTNYTVTIRRSTLRFVETYEYPSPKEKGTSDQSTETGHCAEFNSKD